MQKKKAEIVELESCINGIKEGLKNFDEDDFCSFYEFVKKQSKKYDLKI